MTHTPADLPAALSISSLWWILSMRILTCLVNTIRSSLLIIITLLVAHFLTNFRIGSPHLLTAHSVTMYSYNSWKRRFMISPQSSRHHTIPTAMGCHLQHSLPASNKPNQWGNHQEIPSSSHVMCLMTMNSALHNSTWFILSVYQFYARRRFLLHRIPIIRPTLWQMRILRGVP